jgi:hypothetical protein
VLCPYQLLLQTLFPTATYVFIFMTYVMVFPLFMVMLCLLAGNCTLRQGVTNVTHFPCGHCKALKQGRCRHVLQDACKYSRFHSIREIKYRIWESVGRGEGYCEHNERMCASYTMLSLKTIYKNGINMEKNILLVVNKYCITFVSILQICE